MGPVARTRTGATWRASRATLRPWLSRWRSLTGGGGAPYKIAEEVEGRIVCSCCRWVRAPCRTDEMRLTDRISCPILCVEQCSTLAARRAQCRHDWPPASVTSFVHSTHTQAVKTWTWPWRQRIYAARREDISYYCGTYSCRRGQDCNFLKSFPLASPLNR